MSQTLENVADVYVLTPMQEGMLFHTISEPGTDVFINQISIAIDGDLNVERFMRCWDRLIHRHDALRTAFVWDGLDEPVQVVRQAVELDWVIHDVADAADMGSALQSIVSGQRHQFDLASAPLTRMALVRLGPAAWRWVWTFHHIILDGWSAQILIDELRALYAADTANTETLELAVPFRYGEYIDWNLRREKSDDERFWTEYLAGFSAPLRLEVPGLPPGPGESGYETRHYKLDSQTTSALTALSVSERVTLNALVSGAWALTLSRWARDRDIVFGVTTSGRPTELDGIESAVGLFINTVPLRLDVQPKIDVRSWLRQVHQAQLQIREREHVPLSSIQRWSDIGSGEALFESLFVFENYPPAAPGQSDRLALGEMDFIERSNYPLAVLAVPGDELTLIFVFDASVVSPEAIESLSSQLETVLRRFASSPECLLGDISVVDDAENRRLISLGSGEQLEQSDACIHHIIERFADTIPEQQAVIFEDRSMTYAELLTEARQLAGRLQEAGVAPNQLVGLYLNRSIEMIVAILGVLEAGGAYVPLDPEYPTEHVQGLLLDGKIEVVVATSSLPLAAPDGVTSITIDDPPESIPAHSRPAVGPDDLAYVIHTSGSRGKPKGVMVSHRNLVASTLARGHHYGRPVSTFLLLSSFAFDSSLVAIFWTLCTGGTIVLPAQRLEQDLKRLLSLLAEHQVTHVLALPALYELMLDEASDDALESLDVAIVAGETCPPHLVASHWKKLPNTELHNEYGPTEATVWSTAYRARPKEPLGSVPIGRPIAGAEVMILDEAGKRTPRGFAGELWIGGSGVAKGYLGRPDLTEEHFKTLAVDSGKRFYRTGDLAAFDQGDQIVFLGRADTQLKIRGHRLEATAVESEIRSLPEVRDVAVTAHPSRGRGGNRLVAYAVPSRALEDLSRIREHLKRSLPDFMVPELLVPVDELPRLPNGKTDFSGLPDPLANHHRDTDPAPPRNEDEAALAAIWAELLGREGIGVHDDYFAIGGDSIISIQMISRARRAGLHLEPSDLTANPTIAGLTEAARGRIEISTWSQNPLSGRVPLGPIQQWFLEQRLSDRDHWNQSRLFRLPANIDVDALRLALEACVAHHDMVRARFVDEGDGWRQEVEGEPGLEFDTVRPETREESERAIAKAQASLKLDSGPLIRTLLIERDSHPPQLLIVVHHLVMDVVSWGVLVDDVEVAYEQLLRDKPVSLPLRGASYRDWVTWLSDDDRAGEVDFWTEQSRGVEVLVDHAADGYGRESSQQTVTVVLEEPETTALLTDANDAYQTRPDELTTAALVAALSAWWGSRRVELAMESHGRPSGPGAPDVTRTLGWFTALYPLSFDLDPVADSGRLVRLVKEGLRGVPDRGTGYGVLRHLHRDPALNDQDLPPVLFNYLGKGLAGTPRLLVPISGAMETSKSPNNQRLHLLEIVAAVERDTLKVDWHFSTDLHERSTMERVADSFTAELRHLIDHCTTAGTGGFTPSDFPDAGLDQEELDKFLEDL